MSQKTSIFSNAIIYTLLGFLPLSFSLFFVPIYTKYLSVEEYGLLNYFTIFSSLLMPIVSLGIDQSAGFLYWDYTKDNYEKSKFLSSTIFLFLSIFCLSFFGLIVIKLNILPITINSQNINLYYFVTLALIFAFCTNIYRFLLALYRNESDLKHYSILNISYFVAILIGSILGIIILKLGAKGAIEARTLGFFIVICVFVVYLSLKNKHRFVLDKSVMKTLIKMSFPLFFSMLIGNFAYSMDKLVLEKINGMSLLGIYAFAYTISYTLDILLSSIGNSIIPQLFEKMKDNLELDFKILNAWIDFIFVMCSIFIFLSFIFIKFFIPVEYNLSLSIISILSLVILPKILQQFYLLYFYKYKKTKFILYLNITYLINISILSYILGTFYGIKGVAFAVLISGWINYFICKYFSSLLEKTIFKPTFFYYLAILLSSMFLVISNLNLFKYQFFYSILITLSPFLLVLLFYMIMRKEDLMGYIKSVKTILFKNKLWELNRH